jgi:hypothetical protein
MWHDSGFRRTIALSLCLLFAVESSGCTSWSAQPSGVVAEKSLKMIRVTRIDGSRVQVYEPRIVEDTLVGYRQPPDTKTERTEVRIPTSEVSFIEVEKVSAGKTIALVGGLALLLVIVAGATSDWGWSGGSSDTTSSPLIYSWDGKYWRLDSGTFAGAIMPSLQRTDLDNLDYARPDHGVVRLKLANRLEETEYVDALSLLAVDHPHGVSVLPDATGKTELHTVGRPEPPWSARDDAGRDVLPRVGVSDGLAWESGLRERDPGTPGQARDGIELAFHRPEGASSGTLVLETRNTLWAVHLMGRLVRAWGRDVAQWYDPATSAAVAGRLAPVLNEEAPLSVLVRVNGVWEQRGQVWEIGPEVAKRVALPLDLSGVPGTQVEIRLESIPNFWMVDYVGLDVAPPSPFSVREIALERAIRNDGRDVRGLLATEDRSYLVMERGEEAELWLRVPPPAPGLSRSYVARTSGWYRIHGAEQAEPDLEFLQAVAAPRGATTVAIRLANEALARLK